MAEAPTSSDPRGAAPGSDLAAEAALLEHAARAAAPIAMAAFRPGRAPEAKTWSKNHDKSIVTETDLAVNAALRETLLGARPDYGWLSEEDADGPHRLKTARQFIVDPIDGTRSFANGEPEFCLSLALAESGRAVAGVIFAPALDALYSAALGRGATLNGAPVAVSSRTEPDAAHALCNKSDLRASLWSGGAPKVRREYVHPIAYRLCVLARGGADALIALRATNEWDVAAGSLIAAEAGAVVTEASGAPYAFNKPTTRVGGCLAAPPELHAALRARLA